MMDGKEIGVWWSYDEGGASVELIIKMLEKAYQEGRSDGYEKGYMECEADS